MYIQENFKKIEKKIPWRKASPGFTHLHWQKQQINKCLNRNLENSFAKLSFVILNFTLYNYTWRPEPIGKQSNGCILNLAAYEMIVYQQNTAN